MIAADWVERTVILPGIYRGASLAWKVCRPMMLPTHIEAVIKALATALRNKPQDFEYMHLVSNRGQTVWCGQRHLL